MKNRFFIIIGLGIITLFCSCTERPFDNDQLLKYGKNSDNTITPVIKDGNTTQLENEALFFMWEEEKMARDVYAYFYNKYGTRIFGNITKSENVHMSAIQKLISNLGLTNPGSATASVFKIEEINELYRTLIDKGSVSLVEAMKVGALIEETDILDLKERMEQNSNAAIIRVYSNLTSGSENHLRAFVLNLKVRGIVYVPVLLDQSYYDTLIN